MVAFSNQNKICFCKLLDSLLNRMKIYAQNWCQQQTKLALRRLLEWQFKGSYRIMLPNNKSLMPPNNLFTSSLVCQKDLGKIICLFLESLTKLKRNPIIIIFIVSCKFVQQLRTHKLLHSYKTPHTWWTPPLLLKLTSYGQGICRSVSYKSVFLTLSWKCSVFYCWTFFNWEMKHWQQEFSKQLRQSTMLLLQTLDWSGSRPLKHRTCWCVTKVFTPSLSNLNSKSILNWFHIYGTYHTFSPQLKSDHVLQLSGLGDKLLFPQLCTQNICFIFYRLCYQHEFARRIGYHHGRVFKGSRVRSTVQAPSSWGGFTLINRFNSHCCLKNLFINTTDVDKGKVLLQKIQSKPQKTNLTEVW